LLSVESAVERLVFYKLLLEISFIFQKQLWMPIKARLSPKMSFTSCLRICLRLRSSPLMLQSKFLDLLLLLRPSRGLKTRQSKKLSYSAMSMMKNDIRPLSKLANLLAT